MHKFFDRLDPHYTKICLYAAVTVLLTLVCVLLLYASTGLFAKLWELICAVVVPLAYGAMLSYLINPLVKYVSSRLRQTKRYAHDGMRRRTAAVILSITAILLVILVLLTIMLLMMARSLANLNWQTIERLLGSLQGDALAFIATLEKRLAEWGFSASAGEKTLMSTFMDVKDFASTALFSVIFAVYFLLDSPRLGAYLNRLLVALLGPLPDVDPSRLLQDANRVFSGYFRGQALDAAVVGVSSGILLTLVGVPYAPAIGLLTGIGNLIPYVGGPVGFASIALMCLVDAAWDKMILGFIVLAIIMTVDANVINPKLLSDNVEVHPMLVIIALIAGGAIGGFVGMLVAVPTAAFIKIQLDRWIDARVGPEEKQDPSEEQEPDPEPDSTTQDT